VIDPQTIFRRLPKPEGINDLYTSQSQVLQEWFERRTERDLVLKLHTGGGKTLVGLLIAQSILNETGLPVIYLSPTNQLVAQTLAKAKAYGIPAVPYQKNADFSSEFRNGTAVIVCNYQALFNGKSRFGVRGVQKEVINAGGIILDDAHVAFTTVRDAFTLQIEKEKDCEAYSTLTNLFRNEFRELGRAGTFDDIVSGIEFGVIEVPYWGWQSKADQVRQYLRPHADSKYALVWPLIRDAFEYCHATISKGSFQITPILPLTDLIPTYADCAKRIFMSATISDDSAIIRTFDAEAASLEKPILSDSLAGIGERMILVPELAPFKMDAIPKKMRQVASWAAQKLDIGTVILTPSHPTAKSWSDVASFPDTTAKVDSVVQDLQSGKLRGPIVFSNRYDGIDLPGNACRLLILDGLPQGASDYELFRASSLSGGVSLNSALAQRVEQGMGRGSRGAGDYCVVLAIGSDLVSWLGQNANLKFLSSSSRAQLEMGTTVSRDIASLDDFTKTIKACIDRDASWTKYHAETLSELISEDRIDRNALLESQAERKSFRLWRDGYHEKAITTLDKYCDQIPSIDIPTRGWLAQSGARIAYHWGRLDEARQRQQDAYARNRNLTRPRERPTYVAAMRPGQQARAIALRLEQYRNRRAVLATFEETVARLVPESSANQFEQGLADFGLFLGFSVQRPDKTFGVGPDVLWLMNDTLGAIIEAKSRKLKNNPFNKENHGQLLVAAEWFRQQYPECEGVRVSVHPTASTTRAAIPGESRVLTYDKLNALITEVRGLYSELGDLIVSGDELVTRCEELLKRRSLSPQQLIDYYLVAFEITE